MDPIDPQVQEIQPAVPVPSSLETAPETSGPVETPPAPPEPFETRVLLKILLGPQGLRRRRLVASRSNSTRRDFPGSFVIGNNHSGRGNQTLR